MKLTKYIHSCLLVEDAGTKVLFDPGIFTFTNGVAEPKDFSNIQAIVVTHSHGDHYDKDNIKKIVELSGAVVIANSEMLPDLEQAGIKAEALDSGLKTIGGVTLKAEAAEHEPLMDSKMPLNIAYCVNDRLLHVGDSYKKTLAAFKGVEILAAASMAPWANVNQMSEFVEFIGPKNMIPMHDGYVNAQFLQGMYANFSKHFEGKGIKFHSLGTKSETIEI